MGFIIRDMKSRGTGIMDAVQPEAQMAEYWKEYFATVYKGAIKIWISVAAAGFASLAGMVIVLTAIIQRLRIPSAALIPIECLCMCAMAVALGVSLSFNMSLETFSETRLDTAANPNLMMFAILVDLSRGYTIAAGAGWFLFLITFITATIDACRRAREKESCSFEPTASALGMGFHGYDAVVPPPSRSRVPTMYDPRVPSILIDPNARGRASVAKDVEMGRADSVLSQEGRISQEFEKEISGPLSLERPQKVQQMRPSRPWSEVHRAPKADEVIHAI
ncbi:uncharacterized protein J4E88_008253 [Alternaria novae-zelandiae]|uniref:uncharacterized protein n=1 Tax=Alternaria novae-zelandiae TaxID=430562 RepID=UPI0020C4EFEF|nr:uncharacterized protein J4E88_008253 [Alternaria novae-zelandiae]KAI4674517.1 hypothetical protein J4E88_008253 [Alternaria novae-zelandiae]